MALFLFAIFELPSTTEAQNLMYLGGVSAAGQSHRLVWQQPLPKGQLTVFTQSLEGVRHGIVGWGPTLKSKGFDINPIAALALGGNNGNHAITPALTIFKESHKWLFDLQGVWLIGRGKNNHGFLIGPIDSVWRIRKNFRLGVTGQFGHWQGHPTANIGPEFRYLLPRTDGRVWLTADLKPTQLMLGGHGQKHLEVGFGLVWDLGKKEK